MSLTEVIQRIRPAPLQVFLVELLGLNRRQVVEFEGLRFCVDPSSQLGAHLIRGDYEVDMVETLRTHLKPGGVFVDLGANEGLYSVLGSHLVGATGRVLGVEPQTRLAPIIDENLSLNGCANVRIEHCLVGRTAGDVTLHLSPSVNTGSTSIFRTTSYRVATETVPCWPLQTLLDRADIGDVDLIKIDTEGSEYDILIDSGALLRSGRLKVIALDYHPAILERNGLSMEDIHALLVDSGYEMLERPGLNSVYRLVKS